MPIAPRTLPPNPSLLAIILIVTTRRGPRFVFQYPATPESQHPHSSQYFGSLGSEDSEDSDSSSEDEGTATSDADGDTGSRAGSIGSSRAGGAMTASLSGRTGRLTAGSAVSTRRTARTLREDAPGDEEDLDDDIEALDLDAGDAVGPGTKKEGADAETGNDDAAKRGSMEWERVFGYPTESLEKLLSPPDMLRKKKFEVMIEDLVFLGYPVFAKEDGSWKKDKKRKETEDEKQKEGTDGGNDGNAAKSKGTVHAGEGNRIPHEPDTPSFDATFMEDSPQISPTTTRDSIRPPSSGYFDQHLTPHSFGSQGGLSELASDGHSTASGTQNGDAMSMFHVVFVMNPPPLEYHIRVQEMYDFVTKKFSKALKYEQIRSGWVEKEAKIILTMKNQAKESKPPPPMSVLWPKIMQKSLLAKAIANVYNSIASNKIAHVSVGSSFDASIQIPQAISTPFVPTPVEPQLPGLWLTTALMLDDQDGGAALSPHAGLLLLEDRDTMLKEIESDNKELATPLAYFIRELTPTKSLQKLSQSIALPLSDMQFLARHLIYWRRARAIPPLHIRDTYIVSPNCDMKQLSKATTLYAQRFSALPSLPLMLQMLSTKPRQYGYLIPSKDHKAAYMEILAWLLRGGWVTQLRTFAWVMVTPAVKAAAAIQLRKEFEEKAAARAQAAATTTSSQHTPVLGGSRDMGTLTSPIPPRRGIYEDDAAHSSSTGTSRQTSRLSPRIDALFSPTRSSRTASDPASITSSTRTAIAATMKLPSPTLAAVRPSPLHTVDNTNPVTPPTSSPLSPNQSVAMSRSTSISTELGPGSVVAASASARGMTPADTTDGATEAGAETLFTTTTALTHLPSTDEKDYETTLVLSPHKANTLESRWLKHIGQHLGDSDLKETWTTLVGYFDGKRAVEEIAGREGWKRRRVDELMSRLEGEGVLRTVRHW